MADTAIAITAGTGTNVDTRTEATNGNHRQVVVLGDPATNAGVAPVDATNGLAVQIIPALPAGTNAIGKLAANSGVDIGDVDVTSLPALPAGTNAIGKVKVTNDAGTVIDPVAAVGGGVPVVSGGYEYETVAASQTGQALGGTGAAGDYISGILVVPATTSPGNVLLLDNATSITVFAGGASSVSNLVPFFIPLGLISVSGAWKITTGANVSCIGCGNFTA